MPPPAPRTVNAVDVEVVELYQQSVALLEIVRLLFASTASTVCGAGGGTPISRCFLNKSSLHSRGSGAQT